MKKVISKKLFFLFFSFVGGSAIAQNLEFHDFDTDEDQQIKKNEFVAVFTDHYADDWDNWDDPGLDDEDFYTFTYSIIDMDNNDLLDVNEWDYGYTYYYGEFVPTDFELNDLDDDDYISLGEYYRAIFDSEYFHTWDLDHDTYLNQAELADRIFENWDTNADGVIKKSEYQQLEEYFSDL